jgi:hypothetical protein
LKYTGLRWLGESDGYISIGVQHKKWDGYI